MTDIHCEYAWLGGESVTADVVLSIDGGHITGVRAGAAPAGASRLRGVVLPGFVDAHSHAFHRALRGRTHAIGGDFWTWRDAMYALAARLDPDSYLALAVAVFAEAAGAGVTHIHEFHYLHHPAGGGNYADPNAMGRALVAAARAAGIRLTLLDTCYLRGGLDGAAVNAVQAQFSDGDAETWAARVDALRDVETPDGRITVGAAVHSVRAVDERAMAAVAEWARARERAIHIHLSEQRAEVEACIAATGRTPIEVARDTGVLGPQAVAVHATHAGAWDIAALAATHTRVCLCPTTERDLADGVGPALALSQAGVGLCLGADSRAVVDHFAEAQAVELDERLRSGHRGLFAPSTLLEAATGSAGLAANQPADLIAVSLTSPRLAGFDPAAGVAHLVFGATADDVTDTCVAGDPIVAGGRPRATDDLAGAMRAAIRALTD